MKFKMKCCNNQNNKNIVDRWILFTSSYWELLKEIKH